jgi:protein-S-isoprenylcysteine O-methyltransferase Ste14
MDTYLVIYIVLVGIYRLAEIFVMTRTGTIARKPVRDWTAWLIMIPYWLIIISPPLEYLAREYRRPGPVALVIGGVFFIAATFVRVKAHLDLGEQFSMFLEEGRERGLVTTGLYAHVRHPLYLANLCLFVACPAFLAVAWSWILTGIGIVGVLVRIEIEERFLRRNFEGYETYSEKTWKVLPLVY